MNKCFFPLLLFFTLFSFAQEQDFNSTSIKVTSSDLEISTFLPDTTAHAVYLFEKGKTEVSKEYDFDLKTTYEAKIKVLDKEGLDKANISIPLSKSSTSSRHERIKNLKASTYKLVNGKILKKTLSPSQVYTEDFETYEIQKFTFPDVEPGDVLVYSYELISPFIFEFTTWYFQEDIPKIYSEFTARIPGNYEYYTTMVGYLKLKSNESKIVENCVKFSLGTSAAECSETVYVMEDIPAFKEEEYMTAATNFISKLKFELKQVTNLDGYVKKYTQSWEDVDREFKSSKGMGRQWRKDGLVDELLPAAIKAMPNDFEKAKKIYQFVLENYNWNEKYNIHADIKLKEVLKDQTGNVMGINTLLHNLYDVEGYEVYPVMASTRKNGLPSRVHPVLSDFNYFFIKLNIGDEEYFLDATEKELPFGELPYRALNGYARLLDLEEGSSWIDIAPKSFSSITYNDSIKINADGTSTGYSEQTLTGYHAISFRNRKKHMSDFEVFNYISKPNDQTTAVEMEFNNVEDIYENPLLRYDLENKSQKINKQIFFNPFSFKFFKKNPFSLAERTYPVDFGYKDAYVYSIILEIPEGYKVTELPETRALRLQGNAASLIFSATQVNEKTVSVQCRLTFPYSLYAPEYYMAIKQFFDQIINVQNQSLIVLEENS